MERRKQDFLLGLVFFAGLGLLLVFTVQLTGFSLTPPEMLRVSFTRGANLREGDPVFVLGTRMGQVDSLEYLRGPDIDKRIRVRLRLDKRVELYDDSLVSIEEGSLLGGRQIEIDPGKSGKPLALGAEPPSRVRGNGIDALGELLDDPQLQADVKGFVAGLREAIDNVNSGDTSIGKLFTESSLYDELLATVESARRSVEEVERKTGPLGRIIYDEEMGSNLVELVADAKVAVDRVEKGEGLLGQITVEDSDLTRNANELVSKATDVMRDLREGKGGLGQLLSDPETAADIKRITSGVADAADNLNDAEAGLLGELFVGKELRADAVKVVDDLEAVVDEIRNGNGLVSRIIFDEEMGEQLSRVLNQVSRAIEDAREAAPIGTFFQVFSAGF